MLIKRQDGSMQVEVGFQTGDFAAVHSLAASQCANYTGHKQEELYSVYFPDRICNTSCYAAITVFTCVILLYIEHASSATRQLP